MKLMNCILFASLALSATFANAGETKAACTAEPSGTVTSDRSSLNLLNGGTSAPARTQSSGATSAR